MIIINYVLLRCCINIYIINNNIYKKNIADQKQFDILNEKKFKKCESDKMNRMFSRFPITNIIMSRLRLYL